MDDTHRGRCHNGICEDGHLMVHEEEPSDQGKAGRSFDFTIEGDQYIIDVEKIHHDDSTEAPSTPSSPESNEETDRDRRSLGEDTTSSSSSQATTLISSVDDSTDSTISAQPKIAPEADVEESTTAGFILATLRIPTTVVDSAETTPDPSIEYDYVESHPLDLPPVLDDYDETTTSWELTTSKETTTISSIIVSTEEEEMMTTTDGTMLVTTEATHEQDYVTELGMNGIVLHNFDKPHKYFRI